MSSVVRLPASGPFVGRRKELHDLAERLRDHRLVAVAGPPGAGKTALVRALVEGAAASFGPFAWVELRDVNDAGEAQQRIAEVLGWRADTSHQPATERERVRRAIERSDLGVLVLDDLDPDLVTSLEPLELLAASPSLRILITAHRALDAQGFGPGATLRLDGLAPDSARELFATRAAYVAPPELVEAAVADPCLDRLLSSLDRLPLAIELAASRLVSRAPGELLAELSESVFDALEPRGGVAGPLWSAIARSFGALAPSEQRALTLIATTLPQPFGRDAVAAVVEASSDATRSADDILDRLLSHSLLTVDATSHAATRRRFRLFDAVRAFAELQLERAEIDTVALRAARRRHRAWLADRVAPWLSQVESSPHEALRQLAFLEPQLAAQAPSDRSPDSLDLTIALALDALWARTGPRRQHLERLEQLERALDADSHDRPRVLLAISRIHQLNHDYFASQAVIERAIAAGESLGWSAVHRARASYYLCRSLAQSMGEPARAEAVARHTIELAGTANLPVYAAGATSALGLIALFQGDAASATAHHQRALSLVPSTDGSRVRPMILAHDANARLALGDLDEAERLAELAFSTLTEAGDEILAAKMHPLVARLAIARGALERAEHHLDVAAHEAERLADAALVIEQLRVRAWLDLERGRGASARANLAEARIRGATILTPRLRAELDAIGDRLGDERSAERRLRLAPNAAGFRLGLAPVVDLRRRVAPRRILEALSDANQPLSASDLAPRGWPGERLSHESAEKRVWTAIWTLRKAGLAAILHHRDGGYRLEASTIERVPFEDL